MFGDVGTKIDVKFVSQSHWPLSLVEFLDYLKSIRTSDRYQMMS